MRILVAILLLVHGLITAAQAQSGFKPSEGVANPAWLSWWPANMGQSWLFRQLGESKSIAGTVAGVVWLCAGLSLIAAALGLLGFIVPTHLWRLLAGIGAILSLVVFVVYAHPFYVVGIGANLAILIVLLWAKWPAL